MTRQHTRSSVYISIKGRFGRKGPEYRGLARVAGLHFLMSRASLIIRCGKRFLDLRNNHRKRDAYHALLISDGIAFVLLLSSNVPIRYPCQALTFLQSNPCHTHRHCGSPLRRCPNDLRRRVLETSPTHTSCLSSPDVVSSCSS